MFFRVYSVGVLFVFATDEFPPALLNPFLTAFTRLDLVGWVSYVSSLSVKILVKDKALFKLAPNFAIINPANSSASSSCLR